MAKQPRSTAFRILRAVLIALLFLVLAPYAIAPLYRVVNPVSTLMLWRRASGERIERTWVPLGEMSPALPRAVMAAEDAKFCIHHGIDFGELRVAFDDADDFSDMRGGSTIAQQTAKNLFLWPGRSVLRKVLEFPLALWLDLVLGKRRLMEIYLNIAEWGPSGEFGAEAAARHAFGRPARDLTAREAALLAAILPNPHTRSAARPTPGVRRVAGIYQGRASRVRADCLRGRGLALAGPILYKRAFPDSFGRPPTGARADFRSNFNGRSEEKNLTLAPRHAPLGRRTQAPGLCRGQGLGRTAPPTPHRPEDRHVPRPAGAQGQDRGLKALRPDQRAPAQPARDIFALLGH